MNILLYVRFKLGNTMPVRNLGYACQNLTINDNKTKNEKVLTDRTCRLANFNLDVASELIKRNTKDLISIMKWNSENSVKFFRVSSNLFPFYDHTEIGYKIEQLKDKEEIIENMRLAGALAKTYGIRLSCHPGPYTCLASKDPDVCSKSIKSVEMHYEIGQMLGSENFCINFHIGGAYLDKIETAKRFCKNFMSLDSSVRDQVTIENDDKPGMWSVTELYEKIYSECGVKLVLDVHHHKFRNDESIEQAASLCFSTWQKETPKIHYSESAEGKMPQAHSDFIEFRIPNVSESVYYDVMIEAKAKDKALIKNRSTYVY
jgi:UV DNA damage endonuclease